MGGRNSQARIVFCPAPRRAGLVRNGLVRKELVRKGACLLAALALGAAIGCQSSECEAARLELASTWQTLRDTAISRQQIPEGTDLSQAEQQERIRVWTAIEDRAELARSSFETPQVTWSSADRARADLGATFEQVSGSDDPMTKGFALTLSEVDRQMADFRKACR